MPNLVSDLLGNPNPAKLNLILGLLCAVFLLFGVTSPAHAGLTFGQNQANVVIAPECNHVPIGIPYLTNSPTFDESSIIVSSDSSWATPSVDTVGNTINIAFDTENVIVSYTATVTVDDGEQVHELFIRANVSPLNIFRLLDDPYRSITYGIQRDGINPGAIIAFDPIQEQPIACLTVGAGPSDFVINDDSTELLVINSVDQNIDVIDLVSFSVKETIDLPQYLAWGDPEDTTANIELGPGNIIYYIDANWGPFLYVLDRSTNTILQAIDFYGNAAPAVDLGFMDIAVNSDKTKMVAMPQYGWSAGVHRTVIGQYTINPNGTVNYVKDKTISGFPREPFEAPALMRSDGEIAILKTISTGPADIDNLDASFVSPIWSMSPNGKLVATADKIFDYVSGNELLSIPGGTTNAYGYIYSFAQAFTSDLTRFVYFDTTQGD